VLNLQGDVVKLVDQDGAEAAAYAYDAWGNLLSASGSMAELNPLRYRGYYYDSETGFYYLQSRYYDPANRRFINADSYAGTGQGILGYNMFAYCSNNPVRRVDSAGCWWGEDAWDWICDKGGEALDWAGDKLEEAADWIADTAVVVWDKVERVGASLYNNLDFSIGIGQGLYLEGTVFDYVGVGAGAYVNYGSLQLNDGNWRFGQEIYSGATATVMGMDFGTASYSYREKGNTIDTNTWSVVDSKKDSVSIFRVTVQFETPKTQTDGLYEQVLELCREQYRGIDSYQETSEANETKINISDGADLLECKIKEAQTSVQVVITKVW
jgi:RHS repeat-associated protein